MRNTRILFVDDDPNILSGYKRALRKDFDIQTAEGGIEALSMIKTEGEFAVIISDMRMPAMDGIQFLREAKNLSPNSVRMMLTGNADQETAMHAVNTGSIFRFLNKPCPPEILGESIAASLEQYRLITSEKELLSETLNNSLQVMVEILSMVNPTAFSRSNRIKRLTRDIALHLGIENPWEVEIAATLSQIGCISVPEEILHKIKIGDALNEKELQLYHQHPQIGQELVSRIPRMKRVAEIIARQNVYMKDCDIPAANTDDRYIPAIGGLILKAVLDFDKLLDEGNLPHQSIKELAERHGWYDQRVLEALRFLVNEASEEFVSMEIGVKELKPGMLLDKPVYSKKGILLLSEKQEVTMPLMLKLMNFASSEMISDRIQVSVPVSKFQVENAVHNSYAGLPTADAIQSGSLSNAV